MATCIRFTSSESLTSTPSEEPSSKEYGTIHNTRHILKYLELDQIQGRKRNPTFHREQYLSNAFLTAKSLYSTDVVGHHGCVNALTFSKLGEEFLATGGDDKSVLVWRMADVVQGRKGVGPIKMSLQHDSNIFTADFSCDNAFLFSGGDDAVLIKHDFKTGQFINSYQHLDSVYCVACHPSSPSLVFTSSEDGCVYIIDTRMPGNRLNQDMVLCEDIHPFQCVAVNPVEPSLVAISSGYKGTTLHDTRQRKEVLRYHCTKWHLQREDGVSVCFNNTGTQLFTLQRRLPPCLFDIWNKEAKFTFIDDSGSYKNSVTMKSGCFMGQRDEFVVSGSDDFRVYVWKIPTEGEEQPCDGECSHIESCISTVPHLILPGHRSIVNQTRYSRVHRVMVTSGVEKIVKIWSPHPLHHGNSVHHSRAPPSRQRYSFHEFARMASNDEFMEPTDPLKEDPAVLALFDSLVDQDIRGDLNSSLSTSASSLDLETSSATSELITSNFDSNSEPDSESGVEIMMENYSHLPFYHCDHLDLSYDDENDDENSNDSAPATPISYERTAVLSHDDSVSPWSDRELQEVDRELREVLGSSANGWETNSDEFEDDGGSTSGVNSVHEKVNYNEKPPQNCVNGESSSSPSQHQIISRLRENPHEMGTNDKRIQNNQTDRGRNSGGPVGANGVGPSRRGKRKTAANSTAASNSFEQYQREDFLKTKSPNSFYSHSTNSDDSNKPL